MQQQQQQPQQKLSVAARVAWLKSAFVQEKDKATLQLQRSTAVSSSSHPDDNDPPNSRPAGNTREEFPLADWRSIQGGTVKNRRQWLTEAFHSNARPRQDPIVQQERVKDETRMHAQKNGSILTNSVSNRSKKLSEPEPVLSSNESSSSSLQNVGEIRDSVEQSAPSGRKTTPELVDVDQDTQQTNESQRIVLPRTPDTLEGNAPQLLNGQIATEGSQPGVGEISDKKDPDKAIPHIVSENISSVDSQSAAIETPDKKDPFVDGTTSVGDKAQSKQPLHDVVGNTTQFVNEQICATESQPAETPETEDPDQAPSKQPLHDDEGNNPQIENEQISTIESQPAAVETPNEEDPFVDGSTSVGDKAPSKQPLHKVVGSIPNLVNEQEPTSVEGDNAPSKQPLHDVLMEQSEESNIQDDLQLAAHEQTLGSEHESRVGDASIPGSCENGSDGVIVPALGHESESEENDARDRIRQGSGHKDANPDLDSCSDTHGDRVAHPRPSTDSNSETEHGRESKLQPLLTDGGNSRDSSQGAPEPRSDGFVDLEASESTDSSSQSSLFSGPAGQHAPNSDSTGDVAGGGDVDNETEERISSSEGNQEHPVNLLEVESDNWHDPLVDSSLKEAERVEAVEYVVVENEPEQLSHNDANNSDEQLQGPRTLADSGAETPVQADDNTVGHCENLETSNEDESEQPLNSSEGNEEQPVNLLEVNSDKWHGPVGDSSLNEAERVDAVPYVLVQNESEQRPLPTGSETRPDNDLNHSDEQLQAPRIFARSADGNILGNSENSERSKEFESEQPISASGGYEEHPVNLLAVNSDNWRDPLHDTAINEAERVEAVECIVANEMEQLPSASGLDTRSDYDADPSDEQLPIPAESEVNSTVQADDNSVDHSENLENSDENKSEQPLNSSEGNKECPVTYEGVQPFLMVEAQQSPANLKSLPTTISSVDGDFYELKNTSRSGELTSALNQNETSPSQHVLSQEGPLSVFEGEKQASTNVIAKKERVAQSDLLSPESLSGYVNEELFIGESRDRPVVTSIEPHPLSNCENDFSESDSSEFHDCKEALEDFENIGAASEVDPRPEQDTSDVLHFASDGAGTGSLVDCIGQVPENEKSGNEFQIISDGLSGFSLTGQNDDNMKAGANASFPPIVSASADYQIKEQANSSRSRLDIDVSHSSSCSSEDYFVEERSNDVFSKGELNSVRTSDNSGSRESQSESMDGVDHAGADERTDVEYTETELNSDVQSLDRNSSESKVTETDENLLKEGHAVSSVEPNTRDQNYSAPQQRMPANSPIRNYVHTSEKAGGEPNNLSTPNSYVDESQTVRHSSEDFVVVKQDNYNLPDGKRRSIESSDNIPSRMESSISNSREAKTNSVSRKTSVCDTTSVDHLPPNNVVNVRSFEPDQNAVEFTETGLKNTANETNYMAHHGSISTASPVPHNDAVSEKVRSEPGLSRSGLDIDGTESHSSDENSVVGRENYILSGAGQSSVEPVDDIGSRKECPTSDSCDDDTDRKNLVCESKPNDHGGPNERADWHSVEPIHYAAESTKIEIVENIVSERKLDSSAKPTKRDEKDSTHQEPTPIVLHVPNHEPASEKNIGRPSGSSQSRFDSNEPLIVSRSNEEIFVVESENYEVRSSVEITGSIRSPNESSPLEPCDDSAGRTNLLCESKPVDHGAGDSRVGVQALASMGTERDENTVNERKLDSCIEPETCDENDSVDEERLAIEAPVPPNEPASIRPIGEPSDSSRSRLDVNESDAQSPSSEACFPVEKHYEGLSAEKVSGVETTDRSGLRQIRSLSEEGDDNAKRTDLLCEAGAADHVNPNNNVRVQYVDLDQNPAHVTKTKTDKNVVNESALRLLVKSETRDEIISQQPASAESHLPNDGPVPEEMIGDRIVSLLKVEDPHTLCLSPEEHSVVQGENEILSQRERSSMETTAIIGHVPESTPSEASGESAYRKELSCDSKADVGPHIRGDKECFETDQNAAQSTEAETERHENSSVERETFDENFVHQESSSRQRSQASCDSYDHFGYPAGGQLSLPPSSRQNANKNEDSDDDSSVVAEGSASPPESPTGALHKKFDRDDDDEENDIDCSDVLGEVKERILPLLPRNRSRTIRVIDDDDDSSFGSDDPVSPPMSPAPKRFDYDDEYDEDLPEERTLLTTDESVENRKPVESAVTATEGATTPSNTGKNEDVTPDDSSVAAEDLVLHLTAGDEEAAKSAVRGTEDMDVDENDEKPNDLSCYFGRMVQSRKVASNNALQNSSYFSEASESVTSNASVSNAADEYLSQNKQHLQQLEQKLLHRGEDPGDSQGQAWEDWIERPHHIHQQQETGSDGDGDDDDDDKSMFSSAYFQKSPTRSPVKPTFNSKLMNSGYFSEASESNLLTSAYFNYEDPSESQYSAAGYSCSSGGSLAYSTVENTDVRKDDVASEVISPSSEAAPVASKSDQRLGAFLEKSRNTVTDPGVVVGGKQSGNQKETSLRDTVETDGRDDDTIMSANHSLLGITFLPEGSPMTESPGYRPTRLRNLPSPGLAGKSTGEQSKDPDESTKWQHSKDEKLYPVPVLPDLAQGEESDAVEGTANEATLLQHQIISVDHEGEISDIGSESDFDGKPKDVKGALGEVAKAEPDAGTTIQADKADIADLKAETNGDDPDGMSRSSLSLSSGGSLEDVNCVPSLHDSFYSMTSVQGQNFLDDSPMQQKPSNAKEISTVTAAEPAEPDGENSGVLVSQSSNAIEPDEAAEILVSQSSNQIDLDETAEILVVESSNQTELDTAEVKGSQSPNQTERDETSERNSVDIEHVGTLENNDLRLAITLPDVATSGNTDETVDDVQEANALETGLCPERNEMEQVTSKVDVAAQHKRETDEGCNSLNKPSSRDMQILEEASSSNVPDEMPEDASSRSDHSQETKGVFSTLEGEWLSHPQQLSNLGDVDASRNVEGSVEKAMGRECGIVSPLLHADFREPSPNAEPSMEGELGKKKGWHSAVDEDLGGQERSIRLETMDANSSQGELLEQVPLSHLPALASQSENIEIDVTNTSGSLHTAQSSEEKSASFEHEPESNDDVEDVRKEYADDTGEHLAPLEKRDPLCDPPDPVEAAAESEPAIAVDTSGTSEDSTVSNATSATGNNHMCQNEADKLHSSEQLPTSVGEVDHHGVTRKVATKVDHGMLVDGAYVDNDDAVSERNSPEPDAAEDIGLRSVSLGRCDITTAVNDDEVATEQEVTESIPSLETVDRSKRAEKNDPFPDTRPVEDVVAAGIGIITIDATSDDLHPSESSKDNGEHENSCKAGEDTLIKLVPEYATVEATGESNLFGKALHEITSNVEVYEQTEIQAASETVVTLTTRTEQSAFAKDSGRESDSHERGGCTDIVSPMNLIEDGLQPGTDRHNRALGETMASEAGDTSSEVGDTLPSEVEGLCDFQEDNGSPFPIVLQKVAQADENEPNGDGSRSEATQGDQSHLASMNRSMETKASGCESPDTTKESIVKGGDSAEMRLYAVADVDGNDSFLGRKETEEKSEEGKSYSEITESNWSDTNQTDALGEDVAFVVGRDSNRKGLLPPVQDSFMEEVDMEQLSLTDSDDEKVSKEELRDDASMDIQIILSTQKTETFEPDDESERVIFSLPCRRRRRPGKKGRDPVVDHQAVGLRKPSPQEEGPSAEATKKVREAIVTESENRTSDDDIGEKDEFDFKRSQAAVEMLYINRERLPPLSEEQVQVEAGDGVILKSTLPAENPVTRVGPTHDEIEAAYNKGVMSLNSEPDVAPELLNYYFSVVNDQGDDSERFKDQSSSASKDAGTDASEDESSTESEMPASSEQEDESVTAVAEESRDLRNEDTRETEAEDHVAFADSGLSHDKLPVSIKADVPEYNVQARNEDLLNAHTVPVLTGTMDESVLSQPHEITKDKIVPAFEETDFLVKSIREAKHLSNAAPDPTGLRRTSLSSVAVSEDSIVASSEGEMELESLKGGTSRISPRDRLVDPEAIHVEDLILCRDRDSEDVSEFDTADCDSEGVVTSMTSNTREVEAIPSIPIKTPVKKEKSSQSIPFIQPKKPMVRRRPPVLSWFI